MLPSVGLASGLFPDLGNEVTGQVCGHGRLPWTEVKSHESCVHASHSFRAWAFRGPEVLFQCSVWETGSALTTRNPHSYPRFCPRDSRPCRGQPVAGGGAAAPVPQLFSSRALVPLVGRARELALLDRLLADEDEVLESAPVLLIAGEPGIGKTALLQASAQHAPPLESRREPATCDRRGLTALSPVIWRR
jgi:hypothetical protein